MAHIISIHQRTLSITLSGVATSLFPGSIEEQMSCLSLVMVEVPEDREMHYR